MEVIKMTNLLNKNVSVTFKQCSTTILGTVIDQSTKGDYILIENELDTYNVCLDKVILTEVKETIEPHHHEQHIEGREIRKHLTSKIKASWFEHVRTHVYILNQLCDGKDLYDIEIMLTFEDDSYEFITTDTYGIEKDAIKRAKQIAKMLKVEYRGVETL